MIVGDISAYNVHFEGRRGNDLRLAQLTELLEDAKQCESDAQLRGRRLQFRSNCQFTDVRACGGGVRKSLRKAGSVNDFRPICPTGPRLDSGSGQSSSAISTGAQFSQGFRSLSTLIDAGVALILLARTRGKRQFPACVDSATRPSKVTQHRMCADLYWLIRFRIPDKSVRSYQQLVGLLQGVDVLGPKPAKRL